MMDGSNVEHSDSDSGESWTMLDNSPLYADEPPQFPESDTNHEGETSDQNDREDDTDGISIISDSDPESTTPCEHITGEQIAAECADLPTNPNPEINMMNPQTVNEQEKEPMKNENDFLRDSNTKMRTYVHRRNKRLSTVLNIIVLGSLITAAGVAIGHMWGAEECSTPPPPRVNKILSNLYKLQEENAFLRAKLKELTLANNILSQQQKAETEKLKLFNKKGFGEGFAHNEPKCDNFDYCSTDKTLESHLTEPEFEKEFISDLDKLKTVYKQNKSWLDEELAARQMHEKASMKKLQNRFKSNQVVLNKNQESNVPVEAPVDVENPTEFPNTERKISYADSLKSNQSHGDRKKRQTSEAFETDNMKDQQKKKKLKRQLAVITESLSDDDDIKKDGRYAETKYKNEKKKTHQKSNKNKKRKNKYEQWEMKGGYMKDYDAISTASSQDVDGANDFKESMSFVLVDDDNQWEEVQKEVGEQNRKKKRTNEQDLDKMNENWYDKRMLQRSEARQRVAQEMFGSDGSKGAAAWYFRRGRRREQIRTTPPRHAKRTMNNYKTKH